MNIALYTSKNGNPVIEITQIDLKTDDPKEAGKWVQDFKASMQITENHQ